MRQSHINFNSISRALSDSMKAMEENGCDFPALKRLNDAQKELRQAIYFYCSRTIG